MLVATITLACDGRAPVTDVCFFGDRDVAPEGQLVYQTADGAMELLEDDVEAPLILGPQGGFMILVSARVRNMDLCTLRLTAIVDDPCVEGEQILGGQSLRLEMVEDDSGFAVPANSEYSANYANLALCPNLASARDIDGNPYPVAVHVEDAVGRVLTLEGTVTPVCPEGSASCSCACDADFTFATGCEPMPDDATDPTGGQCPSPAT